MYSLLRFHTKCSFRSSTQVSLKAREVLISCQMPSYEERRAQMEAILKASTTNSYYGEPGSVVRSVSFVFSWLLAY